jgi:hypothetical protein
MTDITNGTGASPPFDYANAKRQPLPGPHWLFVDPSGNACLWVVAGPRFDSFLLNAAALAAFRDLPTPGEKFVRFQGGSANVDRMLPLADVKIDPGDTYNIGDRGLAYRVHLGARLSGPTTFPPPTDTGDVPY